MEATLDHRSTEGRDQTGPQGTRRGLVLRLGLVILLIALLGGGLWYFNEFKKQAIAQFFAGNVPPPTTVTAITAESRPMPRSITGIGTLTAINQVRVTAETAGRVIAVLFEPGSEVRAGEALVQLNDAPERAELASYQAQARLAEANLKRTSELATQEFSSKASLDQNQALLEQARAEIKRVDAMIAQKLVRAPFDGRLGIREVEVGQYVTPGAELVTLTDLGRLYVDLTVAEQQRQRLKPGLPVEITNDAIPDRTFKGELTTVEPQVDPATRAIKVQATLDNPEELLLPGMFANARIILPDGPAVVMLPETAIAHTLYGESVFIVRDGEPGQDGEPQQKVEQTFLRTGEAAGGQVAVLDGVKPGDRVVSAGQFKLQNEAPVRVVTDTALTAPDTPPRQ